MEEFQIMYPSRELMPYVKRYWFLKSDSVGHIQEIVPTGHISLFFHRGDSLFSIDRDRMEAKAYITGQTTTYNNLRITGHTDIICIDFIPYGAKIFFGIPMTELQGESVDLDYLRDYEISELGKQLSETSSNELSISLIERFLMKRFSLKKNYNLERMTATFQKINNGQTEINELAGASCLSYKQFKRIFAEYVGTNPKDFLRIIRFQKALYILQINPLISLTELSFECGYYDQSHFIKEFKVFSGYTPSEYIRTYNSYSDYFS